MGRQSARILYKGNDNNNIFFKDKDQDSLRMHFQMYKGNELVWEKLPPNFLLYGDGEDGYKHFYESVKGKKFDDLGRVKYYTDTEPVFNNIIKIKNRLFSFNGKNRIAYTDNWFSWKLINPSIYNGERILDIANHNEKLLICTTKKLYLYDIDTNEIIFALGVRNDVVTHIMHGGNINLCASKGDTTVVLYDYYDNTENHTQTLFTIKDSAVVYGITFANLRYSQIVLITSNNNYFIYVEYRIYDRPSIPNIIVSSTIYSSKDGITWNEKDSHEYITEDRDIIIFFKGKFYFVIEERTGYHVFRFNEDGSGLEKIDYKIDLGIPDFLNNDRRFCIATEEYIYWMKKDELSNRLSLIRFRDFCSDEYETVIDDGSLIIGGIYYDFEKRNNSTS